MNTQPGPEVSDPGRLTDHPALNEAYIRLRSDGEHRFFVEGEAQEGDEYAECPLCGYREQRDFKSGDSPPLTF